MIPNRFASFHPAVILLFGLCGTAAAATESEEDFFADDFEERALAVNEGELVFLTRPPERIPHHHQNHLTIDEDSLLTGWVGLQQCHDNLDRVPRTQITYQPGRMRNLRLVSQTAIGDAWVQDSTVQLRDIRDHAQVCIAAETRALHPLPDGSWELRNGPFMRRFLDGYYPMRVSLTIDYPTQVRLAEHSPASQPGLDIRNDGHRLQVEALFEGRLSTRFHFVPSTPD